MSTDRLSVIDEIFLRTHRGYGIPIALQGIWRSEERVDRVDFDAVHSNLAYGRLGRRVHTPAIPGARRRWITSDDTLPIAYEADEIDDVLAWADAQADLDLDPEFGPGWRMSVARPSSGGTVMSLVCSHALADAAGLIAAAGDAFVGREPRRPTRRRSDVADAVAVVTSVAAQTVRASAGLIFSRSARRELTRYVRSTTRPRVHDAVLSTAVFDIAGRITNSEFIFLAAAIAAELGETHPVDVNVPFRSTTPGSNAIGMATIEVNLRDRPADIKRATKAAFAAPAGAPSGFPAEIVSLLPDSVAASLTSVPGTARVLCSNIGELPRSIETIGGHPATSVVTRALHPRANGTRTTTALSAYLSSLGDRSTLSLVATEPSYGPVLAECAAAVLAREGVAAAAWEKRTTVNP